MRVGCHAQQHGDGEKGIGARGHQGHHLAAQRRDLLDRPGRDLLERLGRVEDHLDLLPVDGLDAQEMIDFQRHSAHSSTVRN